MLLLTILPLAIFGQNKGGNNCTSAYDLQVSPTSGCQNRLTDENTTVALPAVFNPPCDNAGINRDLWYRFTAPANGEIALLVNLKTAFRIEGAIYTDCPSVGGTNTPIYCNNTGLSGQIIKGLTPGDTYYLQLWSDDFATGTFDLCLSETELLGTQDDCQSAIFLPVYNITNACAPLPAVYVADNFGATNDPNLPIPSCGSYGQGKDVWYAAVVPPSGQIHAEVGDAGGPNDWVMAAYAGDCGNLSEIDCNDDSNNFFPALDLSGLVPGDTILFRIWEYGGDGEGAFTLSFTDPFTYAPDNDDCTGAKHLLLVNTDEGCNLYRSCGYSAGATPSSAPTPSCGVFNGARDVWYYAILPNGGDLNIILYQNQPNGSHSWSVAAYSGQCGNMSILGCAQGDVLNYPSLSLAGLNPGDTVWVRVSDNGNAQEGTFFICAKTSSSLATSFSTQMAYAQEDYNIIEWTFLSDNDNFHFEIQRSENGVEWNRFKELYMHAGEKYRVMDETPFTPVSYYRILAIEEDGRTEFSAPLTVYREANEDSQERLFPNPASSTLLLNTALDVFGNSISTEIYAPDGRIIKKDAHKALSPYLLSIDVNDLPLQTHYILRVIGNKLTKSYQFYK